MVHQEEDSFLCILVEGASIVLLEAVLQEVALLEVAHLGCLIEHRKRLAIFIILFNINQRIKIIC